MVKTPQTIINEIGTTYIPNTTGDITAPILNSTLVDTLVLIQDIIYKNVLTFLGATRIIVTSMALATPPGASPADYTA